ncbi:MAG: DegT/DnrJ/EryC1/StrS family aminotransferase, partial [Candidatus Omnitrophota bacterium]
CGMPEIHKIAKKHDLTVIEDACHALGAEYKHNGKWIKVGSCRHSDMTVFSFHPVKHITTGEGGAVTTNSKRLYEKLLALRSHGTYKTPDMEKEKGPWYYEMRDLGFNYRITDMQCALGKRQLKKINSFLAKRRHIASAYNRYFQDLEDVIKLPGTFKDSKRHAWHLFVLRLKLENLSKDRKYIFNRLRNEGIGVQVHYIPVYRQPYYSKLKKWHANAPSRKRANSGKLKKSFSEYPGAEKYYKECLSIPIYPGLDDKKVKKVADTIKKCVLPFKKQRKSGKT